LSDKELVERTIAGDKRAFECLYDKYAPLIRAVCFDTTRELPSAQDLAQEVFFRAYTKLSTLDYPANFGGWLAGVAKHTCLEWRRKKSRDRHKFNDTLPVTLAISQPVEDERLTLLQEAMKDLSEHERIALHAFYLQGKSAEAARSLLRMSLSGFYKLLDRARHKLERGITHRREAS